MHFLTEEAFSALKNKLISSSLMLFLPSSGTILPGTAKEAKLSSVLAERFKVANKPPKSESGQRSGCSMSEEPLSVELVESTVCGGGSGELPGGPSVSVKLPVDDTCVLVHVALDCLALVNWDSSVSELVSCFKKGLCKQLESVRDEVFWKVNFFVVFYCFPFLLFVFVALLYFVCGSGELAWACAQC